MARWRRGRFVGHITEAQGAAEPHALVNATNMGTNRVQTLPTDATGDFVSTPVSAGVYSLSVTATGFETINAANIEVQVGQIVREDLELKVGEGDHHRRRCTPTSPLLSTDSATTRNGYDQQAGHKSPTLMDVAFTGSLILRQGIPYCLRRGIHWRSVPKL